MTALLEYIDPFLLNAQKGQFMLQISFKCQHYSSIIPAPLAFVNFFTHQTFPNPDSSKFSTIKNLYHTVAICNTLTP